LSIFSCVGGIFVGGILAWKSSTEKGKSETPCWDHSFAGVPPTIRDKLVLLLRYNTVSYPKFVFCLHFPSFFLKHRSVVLHSKRSDPNSTKTFRTRQSTPNMPVLSQITFEKEHEQGEDEQAGMNATILGRAHKIANFPGLIWKVWIIQPEANILGGTYLFRDKVSAQAYLDSPIPDYIRHCPKFTTAIFEIEEEFSAITHAPLTRPVAPSQDDE